MSNNKNKISALCEYLKKNHTGRENAASSKTLEAIFNSKGSEIRKCINALRCDGFPVCSDTVGYYYAASPKDVDATIAQLDSRITRISDARNGLLRAQKYSGFIPITIEIKMSVG